MKYLKWTSILIGTISVILICSGLYFVTQFSAVYPPMAKYHYSMNVMQLQKTIIDITNIQQNISYQLTDTVGSNENGFAYYMNVKIKDIDAEYEYTLKYNEEKKFWKQNTSSELDIISAFDNIHKTGGYKIEGKDVKKLIDIFENEIINKIEKNNTSR
ncbi:MAG: hypothetical protein R2750_09540 [Bacteroidales bacterium]